MSRGDAVNQRHRTQVLRPHPFKVTAAQLARAQRWPIGQAVTVTKDDGSQIATKTRCAPWKLGGTWVVMVDGISGGYALARVVERCDHKFIDSTSCLKCGWTPPAAADVYQG
jgi:hypothetical protein